MKIMYDDSSDYGQELLEILGELSSLMEEDKLYTKTQIINTLRKTRNKIANLRDKVQWTLATDDYYNPFCSIEQWHKALKELETGEKE